MAFYTIHPREINTIITQKHAVVVDVRGREDYMEYHFKNAVNIPYSEDECWIKNFSKRRVWILYCEHGGASLFAARRLGKAGVEVYTVVGGARALEEYFYN